MRAGGGLPGQHLAHGGDTGHGALSEGSLPLMKGEALNVMISEKKKKKNEGNFKINKDLDLKATYRLGTEINGEWQVFVTMSCSMSSRGEFPER